MTESQRKTGLIKGLFMLICGLWILVFAVVALSGCDSGDIITEIVECQLPPGHCNMDDEEFAFMFDALTPEEQAAYIEQWGQPQDQRTGFVS